MTTTFVLDTNVILSAGKKAFYSFGENDVVIPLVVVKELESKKSDPDIGFAARSALKELDRLNKLGEIRSGITLGDGFGSLRIETHPGGTTPEALQDFPSNDTKIITVAVRIDTLSTGPVALVTKDFAMRVFASLVGLATANFVPANLTGDFIDRTETFVVPAVVIDEIHDMKSAKLTLDVPRNAGVILRSEDNPKHSVMVIADKEYTFNKVETYKVSGLESRSAEQAFAIDYLMNPAVKIVSLGGRAGTGKTTLALAAAVEQYNKGLYKKIIVFRSMHSVGGEELGFLPGTEAEKMDPWTAAIYDSLKSFMEPRQIQDLKVRQAFEVLPLTHIRGRNFANAFILIDECQNLDRPTIMTALTRLGKGSKAVMSWDVSQRDNIRVGRHDGIYDVTNRLLGEKLFAHTSLQKSERSDVAELVSRKLDDFEF